MNKKGGKTCCVPQCNNSQYKNPDLSFYLFPNREWETERKKTWITRIKREPDWIPTKTTRICSAHFVGGVKSDDPRKTAFNPSIFPWKPENPIVLAPEQRLINRSVNKESSVYRNNDDSINNVEHDVDISTPKLPQKTICEIAIQTGNFFHDNSHINEELPVIYCWQNSVTNEASTQANIPSNSSCKTKVRIIEIEVPEKKSYRTVAVGPNCNLRRGFHGFADVNTDEAMKQLGGISLSFFYILLNFIQPQAEGQEVLNAEDRLLLFLMKMKLGLPFTAISCIFQINKQTARNFFFEVLDTLYLATKTWIFWPSKEAIKRTLPSSFETYPNCRGIIDSMELQCETPPTVEQRASMYSTFKSDFTIKYLIGLTPCGFISFVSKGYGGRSSDSFIVNDSGFINLIEPGDEIMTDKEFPQIRSELLKRNSVLIIPPQFSRDEVLQGYPIGSLRIHVERSIQRFKIFKVLDHISVRLLPYIDKVTYIACVLANNKEPLIIKKEEPWEEQ